ncbi:MAG: hypothetical protein ACK559_19675 [bacterium]
MLPWRARRWRTKMLQAIRPAGGARHLDLDEGGGLETRNMERRV